MFGDNLDRVVKQIEKNYEADEIFFTKPGRGFPKRDQVEEILYELRRITFPGYFGRETLADGNTPKYFIGNHLMKVEQMLKDQLMAALEFRDGSVKTREEIEVEAARICTIFFDRLPEVQRMLLKDVQASFDGDPAAQSKEEVIFSYPGLFAIFTYRIAHELYVQDVPLIPRMMTEHAHSRTGIDINAGATIGEYFFIDHGTGIVVGETTTIGNNVKIYQGVTLGALSLKEGQNLRGVKRHPTIEDNVTIYANACVLGGNTVIGSGTVIGGSAFVTKSVPRNSRVLVRMQELDIKTYDEI